MASLPELNQIPVPELLSNPICNPLPSGIDVGGFRGSLNAATGTHEFGLGSVKEIIEAPVESSSGQGMKLQVLFAVVRQRSEATCYIGSRAC